MACGAEKDATTQGAADSASTLATDSVSVVNATQPNATCDTASFRAFWREFRTVVQRGEGAEVQSLVADTFAVRGALDSDAWVRVPASDLAERWSLLLEQDAGLNVEPESLREYVMRTDTPPAQAVDPSQVTARVADLVFQCANGRWRLSRAYITE